MTQKQNIHVLFIQENYVIWKLWNHSYDQHNQPMNKQLSILFDQVMELQFAWLG